MYHKGDSDTATTSLKMFLHGGYSYVSHRHISILYIFKNDNISIPKFGENHKTHQQ